MNDEVKKNNSTEKEISGEDYDKIYELYGSKSGEFQKVFVALLIAGVLFMFIILVPYVSILQRGFDNNKDLISLNENATQIQSNIGNITAANTSMLVLVSSLPITDKELSSLISNVSLIQFSSTLSNFNSKVGDIIKSNNNAKVQDAYLAACDFAKGITSTINPLFKTKIDKLCTNSLQRTSSSNNHSVQNLTNLVQQINEAATLINFPSKNDTLFSIYTECNANSIASDAWPNCILKNNIKGQIKKYRDIFFNHTLPPLYKLDDESKKLIPIDVYKRNFTDITDRFLQRSEIFFGEKNNSTTPFQMSNEFKTEITNPLQNGINMLKDSQNKTLSSVNDKIQKDKDVIISVERQKDNIAARLNSTQFVIGTLPLTLTQTIAGLPVALAIGFLICVTLLKSTIKLFGELRRDSHQKIVLFAPLWIYPTGTKLNIIARFLVFSTPFVLFITAWCLIGYSFTLCPHNKDLLNIFGIDSKCMSHYSDLFKIVDFRFLIYTGLYIISEAVFIIGLLSIVITFYPNSRVLLVIAKCYQAIKFKFRRNKLKAK